MFRYDFQPMGGFDLFATGRSHFLLGERSLSFNNVMISLTSARLGARIVELGSGVPWYTICECFHFYLRILTAINSQSMADHYLSSVATLI